MDIRSDIPLRGVAWDSAINGYNGIFEPTTQYTLFMLALAVGIMYDKRIDMPEGSNEYSSRSVPRNVVNNYDRGKLDFYFQAAILTTTTEDFSEERRLELAFGNDPEYKKIDLLVEFANFGVTKLLEQVGGTAIETMENLKNFLTATVEGRNFDIDALMEEDLDIFEYDQ